MIERTSKLDALIRVASSCETDEREGFWTTTPSVSFALLLLILTRAFTIRGRQRVSRGGDREGGGGGGDDDVVEVVLGACERRRGRREESRSCTKTPRRRTRRGVATGGVHLGVATSEKRDLFIRVIYVCLCVRVRVRVSSLHTLYIHANIVYLQENL